MSDHAKTYDRYHAGPGVVDSPITVTLSDGRVLAFVDYEFTRGHDGSRLDPPDSDEVDVHAAWWVEGPDGCEVDLTADELDALFGGPEYDAILLAVQEVEGERYWAAMADSSYAAMGDPDDV